VDFTTLIDVESLRALVATPGIALLDCRFDLGAPEAGREAYLRSHIPGARYVDLNRDLSAPVSAASGRHPLPDPVALDAYVAKAWWNLDPEHLPYLQMAAARGLGTLDYDRLPVKVSQLG